ncbi:MAG: prolyl oligopeptidase family serine peptidase [Gammaproteobacteria bacterium]|nr:prolyl oligopeptidase family serine peptidase [Gammaproteobacteria bacterium]MYE82797.1 prolyl oligopeptidase family serine peptidase [Gammaproteobacteria bacterium]
MSYDPFQRGDFPVGVRHVDLDDDGRHIPLTVWFPATDAHQGQDLAADTQDVISFEPPNPWRPRRQAAVRDATPRDDVFPLVVYSHGATDSRFSAGFLATHLASHGYVVAAADHPGDNKIVEPGDQYDLAPLRETRPRDIRFVTDRLLGGAVGSDIRFDADRIGLTGVSFGGWTTLMMLQEDDRFSAAVPLTPGLGDSPLSPGMADNRAVLDLDAWPRPVPTLLVAGDRDALVLIDAMRALFQDLPEPKRMVEIHDIGHFQFVEHCEERHDAFVEQLRVHGAFTPGIDVEVMLRTVGRHEDMLATDKAHAVLQALLLAQMDAHLKDNGDAASYLASGLENRIADHGAKVTVA